MSGSQVGIARPVESPPGSIRQGGRPLWKRRATAFAIAALVLIGGAGYLLTRPDAAPVTPEPEESTPTLAWQPGPDETLQLQLSGKVDTSYDADIYIVDLNDTSPAAIEKLHAADRKVVCYLSAGAWEEWRPDADSFPVGVLGDALQGSTTERWLDISQLETLRPIIATRLAECAEKGFDGVSFDNIDGYGNETGFDLTEADQIAFNEMLGQLAHDHGLAAGSTNAPELAQALGPDFDLALSTGCYQFEECDRYRSFADAGKPVFVIEFEVPYDELCRQAEADGYIAQLKRYNLSEWRRACWE